MSRPTRDHLARTHEALDRLAHDHHTDADYYLVAQLIDLLAWLQAEIPLQSDAAAHGRGALFGTIGGQSHASTVEDRLSWPTCKGINDPTMRVELTRRFGGQNDDLLRELQAMRRRWRPWLAELDAKCERDMLEVAKRADRDGVQA